MAAFLRSGAGGMKRQRRWGECGGHGDCAKVVRFGGNGSKFVRLAVGESWGRGGTGGRRAGRSAAAPVVCGKGTVRF